MQFVSSGPVVAMELMGDEAMSIWRKLLGPADSAVAQKEAPQCVRARFGTDSIKNVGHGSDSLAAAARVSSLVTVEKYHCAACSTFTGININIFSVCFIRSLNFFSLQQLATVPPIQPSIQTAHAASSNLMPSQKVRTT